MSDKESQKDEICALESIYNEEELQTHEENGLLGGQFCAYIALPTGFKVVFRDLRQEESSLQEFVVKYLPPLSLHFTLPQNYPSHSPPSYMLSCQWLQNSKQVLLRKKLDALWKENEGMEILFLWTQFLKEESLKFLEITDVLNVSSLETSYMKHKEFKETRRAYRLATQDKRKEEKCENSKVSAPIMESNVSAARPTTIEYPKRKQRGKPRWGRRDRVVAAPEPEKRDDLRYEQKTEKRVPERNEAQTTDIQSTRTIQDNSNNTNITFNNNNRRPGNRIPRSHYRGSYAYHNRSVQRGNSGKDDCRSDSSKSDEQISLNNSKGAVWDEGHKSSSESSVVDHPCSNSNDSVECANASFECAVDSQKNDVELESAKCLDLMDVGRKSDGQLAGSNVDDVRRRNLTYRPRMSIVQLVMEYSEARERTEFGRNFYTCKICFQDKKGFQCTCFEGCSHVFCKSCVAEYFEVRIKDGSVHNICCPEEKCTSEAMPSQVRELVSAELFSRYDTVLLSALLDTMEDVLYCPRPACQYPVAVEPGEKMAKCPSCAYVFCIYCKMVYHGIEPCRFRTQEKRRLVEEYCNGSEERRLQMEQRYGRKQLQSLVDTSLSENWLHNHSKNCPHCGAAIEKSDGCNKMVCWKCNTFFCWLCEVRLNPQTPYLHFTNPASKCYNLLFLGVPLSDDEDEDWMAGPGMYLQNEDDDDD